MKLKAEQRLHTHSLFALPGLHSVLVLLELVAPVRVYLVVVMWLAGRWAAVSVHGDVVGTQQRAAQPAVVAAWVRLVHRHNHQSALTRLYVLVSSVTLSSVVYSKIVISQLIVQTWWILFHFYPYLLKWKLHFFNQCIETNPY